MTTMPHDAGHQLFTDADGATLHVEPINTVAVNRLGPAVLLNTSEGGTYITTDRLEEFIEAVREAARVVAHRANMPCIDQDCGPCSFDRAFAQEG